MSERRTLQAPNKQKLKLFLTNFLFHHRKQFLYPKPIGNLISGQNGFVKMSQAGAVADDVFLILYQDDKLSRLSPVRMSVSPKSLFRARSAEFITILVEYFYHYYIYMLYYIFIIGIYIRFAERVQMSRLGL